MGGFEAWGLLGNCGGLQDTVEPCLCRDGYRSMGLMGWWWETAMSGNRQPFRVGPVREAYWGPSSLPLTELACGGQTGGGTNGKKRGGLSKRVHTLHPTIRLLFWRVTWASSPGLKRTYSMCPRKMLWSITSLGYLSFKKTKKQQLQSTEHICVMLAGSEEKETNLAGCLVWRAWHFGSQLQLRASQIFLRADTKMWGW